MKILDSNRRITSEEVKETPILIIEEKEKEVKEKE